MLTTSAHLQIRRPSPTAAEFTVTTRPRDTLGLRALLALVFLGRCVLAAAAVVLLHGVWEKSNCYPSAFVPGSSSSFSAGGGSIEDLPAWVLRSALWLLAWAHASAPGKVLGRAADACPAWAAVLAGLALLHLSLRRVHTSESLLVLRGLGVQTRSDGGLHLLPSLGGGPAGASRFIPTEKIRDVLINEAFKGFEVRYYLVVVVEGEDELVVVFPRLLPRREIVERVWRGVRGCLFEGEGTLLREGGKG